MVSLPRDINPVEVDLDTIAQSKIAPVHVTTAFKDEPVDLTGFSSDDAARIQEQLGYRAQEKIGKEGNINVVYYGTGKAVLVLGMGATEEWKDGKENLHPHFQREQFRDAYGGAMLEAAGLVGEHGAISVAVPNPDHFAVIGDTTTPLGALTEVVVRTMYNQHSRWNPDSSGDPKVTNVHLLTPELPRLPGIQASTFQAWKLRAEGENIARFWGEAPENYSDARDLAEVVHGIVDGGNGRLRVYKDLGDSDLRGMPTQNHPLAAFQAVSGPDVDRRFMILKYDADVADQRGIAIAGKGITFDTGGNGSLKPADGQVQMNGDMYGAATVIGYLHALAQQNLGMHLTVYLPMTRNLPGPGGYNVTGLFNMGDGPDGKPFKTAEVYNTDAEGRMVLASAAALSALDENIVALQTLATLTGAQMFGTGSYNYGIHGNTANPLVAMLMTNFEEAGIETGEFMHQFPAHFRQSKGVEDRRYSGSAANLGNSRWAGAQFGYEFLAQWQPVVSHADIAGALDMNNARKGIGGSKPVFNVPPVMALDMAMQDTASVLYKSLPAMKASK